MASSSSCCSASPALRSAVIPIRRQRSALWRTAPPSPRCTWASTRPGDREAPCRSTTCSPAFGHREPISAITPSCSLKDKVSAAEVCAAADAAAAHTSAADTLSLRLQEGVIAEIGSLCPKAGEQVVDLQGAYLSPGLVDAHVHLGLGGAVRQSALRCLQMGVTALRNAGDALQQEEEEAMAEMSSDPSFPKVLTAGRALARGEGYGGFLGHSLRPNADLGQTVAEEIGRGADFIKVIVSGAVDFSRSAVEGPYFSESQLKEVVAVASSFGVPVAAHANGSKSIGAAVRAGVSTLEHGILIDDRGMEEMCAHGTAWVPTLTPLFNLSKSGRYPALQGLLDRHQ